MPAPETCFWAWIGAVIPCPALPSPSPLLHPIFFNILLPRLLSAMPPRLGCTTGAEAASARFAAEVARRFGAFLDWPNVDRRSAARSRYDASRIALSNASFSTGESAATILSFAVVRLVAWSLELWTCFCSLASVPSPRWHNRHAPWPTSTCPRATAASHRSVPGLEYCARRDASSGNATSSGSTSSGSSASLTASSELAFARSSAGSNVHPP
mmetsp:Transcript_29553/g.77521  ORF Transcript_29553/g.77521 Transcript_29553/m.77521 type:complete len:213 (+) Transcript_29553:2077-2715(+)